MLATKTPTMAKKRGKEKKPDEIHQVIVRMPYHVYKDLEKDAEENLRTANMHILWLIRQRLRKKSEDEPEES